MPTDSKRFSEWLEEGSKPGTLATLASFQRSLFYGNTAFDRYQFTNDQTALDASAIRGLSLFRRSAGCATCHTIDNASALFTDNSFHRLNVGFAGLTSKLPDLIKKAASSQLPDGVITRDPDLAELGRYLVTKDPKDIGKFRTPTLRNIALTAPYMHDGSVATIEEAIDLELYYRGITGGRPVVLTPSEKADLAAFLRSLTSLELELDYVLARQRSRCILTKIV